MQITIELNEDQFADLIGAELKKKDQDDPLGTPLSIVFVDGKPVLFFCPDWGVAYEARLPLRDALATELDDHLSGNEDENNTDKIALLKRLIEVLDGKGDIVP
jgi:hypothetical protein